jgi:hypothetical protein
MSTKSGKTTKRTVIKTHKGFEIVRVTTIYYAKGFYGNYYTDFVESCEEHYSFCKEGLSKRPSQYYNLWAKNSKECEEEIEKFIEDNSLYFTEEEREKYVYKPNRQCGWAYGYDSLMKIVKQHKKADKRMKILLEDRLTDANFHYESGLLSEQKYEELIAYVTKEYTFRERFTVTTFTQAKRISNAKELENGIAKAVEDYLKSVGIKDTTVKAQFVENW